MLRAKLYPLVQRTMQKSFQVCSVLDFITVSVLHIYTDEVPDVPQFVTIKVHQEHAGASNGGIEWNTGFGLLFGAHRSNPARMIPKMREEFSILCLFFNSCIQML